MGDRFEVGCSYYDADHRFNPVTVTKRTDKTIWVTNGSSSWMMRILGGGNYGEYAKDSSLPKAYRCMCMYHASNKVT